MTTLQELIETHKATCQALEIASARLESVQIAYDAAQVGNRVALKIGKINVSADQGAETLNGIADDVCERLTRDLLIIEALSPSFAAQFQAGIAKIRADLTPAIDAVIAEETARQEAFGLAGARREWDRLYLAEQETLLAVCRHRCETLAEERQRIAYVVNTETYESDADVVRQCSQALFQSTVDPPAA